MQENKHRKEQDKNQKNSIQMSTKRADGKDETVKSEKIRYENADEIYKD